MSGFILGEKFEQSQQFTPEGIRIPTTFIKTSPCYVTGIKWPAKHGYFSLMLGFNQTKNIKNPVKGQLKKAGIETPLRFLKEFRLEKSADKVKFIEEKNTGHLMIGDTKVTIGQEIKPEMFFKKGDFVSVSGISKGKGFQGVVKRHGFKGGPRTHGQSDRERGPGSIGQTTTPGRVYKGKRMAGRMGGQKITIKGLEVVDVKDTGLILRGLVPGFRTGLLEVIKSS